MAADEGERGAGVAHMSLPVHLGEQTFWADASPLIEAACNDLRGDELIHGENFNLFAAMSALEIMDPKMDSGMESSDYRSIDEAIESDAAPIPLSPDRTVDFQRTIDVMDHLISCEATWHRGYPLAQTVFSCIYLLQLERTSSHALLHSYCRITRATCNAIISIVSATHTHQEEDIMTAAYGLPLKGNGDEKCLPLLNSVEEILSRQSHTCRMSRLKNTNEDLECLQIDADQEEQFCNALLCRIRFRKYFYHVLMCMKKPQGRGFDLARKHIASCLVELSSIHQSSEFLRSIAFGPLQDNNKDGTTASGCQPIGFDASLNSRLSAPLPPRAVKILSWMEATKHFEKLLQDLHTVCSFPMDARFEAAQRFVVHFQKSNPDLIARAHLQHLLVQEGKFYGRESFDDVILRALALPDAAKSHEYLKDFHRNELLQLGQLTINILKVLCTNAAWQRRKLGKMVQDWSIISIKLELAFRKDFGDSSSYLSDENIINKRACKHLIIWVQEQMCWIASRFLMLGFQLELYSPHEYCMIYWYLHVIFMKHMEKLQIRVAESNENSRRKGKNRREFSKGLNRDAQVLPSALLLQCYACLSEGLALMMAAVAQEQKSFKLPNTFNSEHERFIQQFQLLQRAHVPDRIPYYMFKESTCNARISSLMLCNYFKEAQKMSRVLKDCFSNDPEKFSELNQIERVAEHNRIAFSIIDRAKGDDSSLTITFQFSHHPCFAVAVVKRS